MNRAESLEFRGEWLEGRGERIACLRFLLVLVAFLAVGFSPITAAGQVTDAFRGILPVTDPAMKRSLNGTWLLKVKEGIDTVAAVPKADATWGTIPVPGCWEAYGFSKPSYDKALPLTGYYRTQFTVPESWRGKRIVLRFDGVLYGYDLWVNGHKAGSWRSGYNTALFDITDYLRPTPIKPTPSPSPREGSLDTSIREHPQQSNQTPLPWGGDGGGFDGAGFGGEGAGLEGPGGLECFLALRVITQFPGSDFDYNDDWAPCGIFRDVTLMAVPETHVSDLTIHTKNTGEVSVETIVAGKKAEVKHEILDDQGRVLAATSQATVKSSSLSTLSLSHPHLWTAETPHLYTLRTTLLQKGKPLQTFNHKFGFRELTIDGNVLKLNGRPIKLRGVTCHSTDPRTVKVVSDDLTLRDMRLMKEASVNYIRTSHYPREPRFYELADSLGFYVISEVPFGFGDKNLQREEFYPVLQQRAQATIRRDKNHPSILIWSLGNENPLTPICNRLGYYVKAQLDSVRPYCYPQVGSYFRRFFEGDKAQGFPSAAPIYAPHYPTTDQIAGFYQHLDRPVIFTEYCHTLGISFEDHDRQWEIIERTPGIAGGSVWEWVDQGMPFGNSSLFTFHSTQKYGYEEKVYTTADSGFEMFGNKGTDGLLYADRTPLPNYYELQHNYARAFVGSLYSGAAAVALTIHNRYDFLNLKDQVTFRWALTNNRDTVMRGAFSPDCAPHDTTLYTLPLPPQNGLALLHFDIADAQGHQFLQQSLVLNKPDLAWSGSGSIEAVLQQQPLVRAGRKPTLAETVTQKGRLPEHYLLPLDNTQVKASVLRTPIAGGEEIAFELTPDTADVFRAELGLALLLNPAIDRVQWMGQGPFASYPARYRSNRYGLWARHRDDLYFEGNRLGVDAALLTDSVGNGLLIAGDSLNLNFEQTDRGLVLTVNAAVAGQGPKFRRTAFPIAQAPPYGARFRVYRIEAGQWPSAVATMFCKPGEVPAPFRPFATQYDTYLMRFADVAP